MAYQDLVLHLPEWLEDVLREYDPVFATREDRMRFVIELSRLNVEHRTGGPFGAGVFEQESGRLLAPGVNLVESSRCSIAHAEMVAIGIAQSTVGRYDLGGEGLPVYELVTSTEPCAMCLGAVPWSGVRRLICGARGEDAVRIGFDEGAKPADWVRSLESRGIVVMQDILREEAGAVLVKYCESGGVIYNGRQGEDRRQRTSSVD
jgi:tRNA(Arg) A34 adenosine deaminase TadA